MSQYDFVSDPELRHQLNAAAEAEAKFKHESMQPKNDKLTQRIIEDTIYTRDDRDKTEIIQNIQLQTIEKHVDILDARVAVAGIDPAGSPNEYKAAIEQVIAALGRVVPATSAPLMTMMLEISEGKDYKVSLATAMNAITTALNNLDHKHVNDYTTIRGLQADRVKAIMASNRKLDDIMSEAQRPEQYPSMLAKIEELKELQTQLLTAEQKFVTELASDQKTVIVEAQKVLELLAGKLNGVSTSNRSLEEEKKKLTAEIAQLQQTVDNQKRNLRNTSALQQRISNLENSISDIESKHHAYQKKQEATIAKLKGDVKQAEADKAEAEKLMETNKAKANEKRVKLQAQLDQSKEKRTDDAKYFMEEQFAQLVNDFARMHLQYKSTKGWIGAETLIRRMNEYFYTFRTSPGTGDVILNKRQKLERQVLMVLLLGRKYPGYVQDESIKKTIEESKAATWPELDPKDTSISHEDIELFQAVEGNVYFALIFKQIGDKKDDLKIDCDHCPSPLVGFVPFVGGAISNNGGGGLSLWQAILIVIVLLALLVWLTYRYRSHHRKYSKTLKTWENR